MDAEPHFRSEIYELGRSGLVRVDVPANSIKNNLPVGAVLRWGGNMGFPAEDFAVISKGQHNDYTDGVYYYVIGLDKHRKNRVEGYGIKSKADPSVWYGQHFFLTERVLTADEVLDLIAAEKHTTAAVQAKQAQDAEARRAHVVALRKAHPELIQLDDKNRNALVTAAKNIRRELAAAFPGVKFSVTTERYSGGDHAAIHWTDGPSAPAVDKIVDKYQGSDFDGMQDLSIDRSNAWIEVFGEAKYVQTSRTISDRYRYEAAALALSCFSLKYPEGAREVSESGDIDLNLNFSEQWGDAWDLQQLGYQMLHGCDLRNGIEGLAEEGGRTVCKGRPVASAVTVRALAYSGEGAQITENAALGGVEIRFPLKPGPEVIAALKASGWRWAFKAHCWYKRAAPGVLDEARRIAGA